MEQRSGEITQCRKERLQLVFVVPPALDRSSIDGIPDLLPAEGPNRPSRLMELQAGLVPWQPNEFDELAGFAFEVGGEILIAQLVDVEGQHRLPVIHQPLIFAIVETEMGEILAVGMLVAETLLEA